jgi:hypothetical protein
MKNDVNAKGKEANTIPVTVVQNNCRDGLRILQLHRKSEFSNTSNSGTTSYHIPLVEATEFVSRTEVAKKYIMECEKATLSSSKKRPGKGSFSKFVPEGKALITCEAAGELNELRSVPAIFEQSFNYKYCDYPIYGAFSRVQLDNDYKLMGLTVVSPLDKKFQGLECEPKLNSEEVLDKVKDIAGYDKVQEQWSKEPSIKWYFDANIGKWRLSYIVEGILKHNDRKGEKRAFGQFSRRVFNYIIDATSGELITEIPTSR